MPCALDITICSPGDALPFFRRGDFILCHSDSLFGKLIRFGQSLRFQGKDVKFSKWNHAALITGENGDLIEASEDGVQQSNISKYSSRDYVVVHVEASNEDRQEEVTYAAKELGRRYGWVHIVSIALSLLSGLSFSFGFDNEMICSGLVAGALERTHAVFDRDTSHITPADLAKYYQVGLTPPV